MMNLLCWLSALTELTDAGRKEIVDAVNNFSAKYRKNSLPYGASAQDLALLDRDEVIHALRCVHARFGTAAVLPIIEKLSADPPAPLPDG
jgi:hypothetical protein